jgi:hypothetical protein
MRRRLSLIPVGMIAALALMPAGALATADGAAAHGAAGSASASGAFPANGFLSPDRKVWCSGGGGEVGCVVLPAAGSSTSGHGAIVKRGGRVILCPEGVGEAGWDCFQNFDEKAHVLHYGRRAEAGGIRCTSARKGITCTVAATGRGFLINSGEAILVR